MICSSLFTEAVPPRRDRSIHGVPLSVYGLVHSLSVPHLRGWTGSFAECTHFVNAFHYIYARMYAHTVTYSAQILGFLQLRLVLSILNGILQELLHLDPSVSKAPSSKYTRRYLGTD